MSMTVQPRFQGLIIQLAQESVRPLPSDSIDYIEVKLVPEGYEKPSYESLETRKHHLKTLVEHWFSDTFLEENMGTKLFKWASLLLKEQKIHQQIQKPLAKDEVIIQGGRYNKSLSLRFTMPQVGELTDLLETKQKEALKQGLLKFFKGDSQDTASKESPRLFKNYGVSASSIFSRYFSHVKNNELSLSDEGIRVEDDIPEINYCKTKVARLKLNVFSDGKRQIIDEQKATINTEIIKLEKIYGDHPQG